MDFNYGQKTTKGTKTAKQTKNYLSTENQSRMFVKWRTTSLRKNKLMEIQNIKSSKNFQSRLEKTKSLPDIFEVVKAAVWECQRKSRGGLMLGLANLGNHPQGFFGLFIP